MPAWHVSADGHTFVHAPQLALSVWVLVQAVPQ